MQVFFDSLPSYHATFTNITIDNHLLKSYGPLTFITSVLALRALARLC